MLSVQEEVKQVVEVQINLVQKVGELLNKSGLGQEANIAYFEHPLIKEASSFPDEGQRFLLNRYWNLQLLTLSVNTIEERFCLISTGQISDWLRLFEQKVLPCCIANRLPQPY